MKRTMEFMSNAIKYYINQRRVSKLRKKGAKIGKNVVICKNCVFVSVSLSGSYYGN